MLGWFWNKSVGRAGVLCWDVVGTNKRVGVWEKRGDLVVLEQKVSGSNRGEGNQAGGSSEAERRR